MFTVLVYRFLDDFSLDLVRRIPNVLSVDFENGSFSVFVLSPGDEPDILLVPPSFLVACCRE